jgi:hypothetical protein
VKLDSFNTDRLDRGSIDMPLIKAYINKQTAMIQSFTKSSTTIRADRESASTCSHKTKRANGVRIRQPSRWIQSILFMIKLTTTLPLVPLALPVQAGLTIGGVSSTTTCHSALHSSSGTDNSVNKDEYVNFINILSKDYFTYPQYDPINQEWANLPISEFYQLPMELQMNFNKLACGGEFITCPDPHLVTDGTGDGETATDAQTIYLYEVCRLTEEAVEGAMKASEQMEGVTASPVGMSADAPTAAPDGGDDTDGPDIGACPPIYATGDDYAAYDRVINPNDDSGGITVYECQPSPYTPWCAQVGYEPGVALAWAEAWTWVGECDPDAVVEGGVPSNNVANDTTIQEANWTNATTYSSIFYYRILVSSNIAAENVSDPAHQMNMDLVKGMNDWSIHVCEEWSKEQKESRELLRMLRGGVNGRRRLVVTTQESSVITNVTTVGEWDVGLVSHAQLYKSNISTRSTIREHSMQQCHASQCSQ